MEFGPWAECEPPLSIQKRLKNYKESLEEDKDFDFQNGLFYYKEFLYLFQGFIQLKILQVCHDFLIAQHFGFNMTIELFTRDY